MYHRRPARQGGRDNCPVREREAGDRQGAFPARAARDLRHEQQEAERHYDTGTRPPSWSAPSPRPRSNSPPRRPIHDDKGGDRLLREVTGDEIAQIVARWTGIPVTRLIEGEREKLLKLDQVLHERVSSGQDEAVQVVADAVIRARSGIKDPRRPIGNFLFLGPTGVGKPQASRTSFDYVLPLRLKPRLNSA